MILDLEYVIYPSGMMVIYNNIIGIRENSWKTPAELGFKASPLYQHGSCPPCEAFSLCQHASVNDTLLCNASLICCQVDKFDDIWIQYHTIWKCFRNFRLSWAVIYVQAQCFVAMNDGILSYRNLFPLVKPIKVDTKLWLYVTDGNAKPINLKI